MRAIQRLGAVALLVAGGVACADTTSPRRDEFYSTPTLTGAAERPTPVTTDATGIFAAAARDTATIGAKKDSLAVIIFSLNVTNINAATAAHIHAGGPNEVGPVMISLFNGPTKGSGFTGLLATAEITRSSAFTAPFTLDSLFTRMRSGTAYVNVHTIANPGGEIRGQIQRN